MNLPHEECSERPERAVASIDAEVAPGNRLAWWKLLDRRQWTVFAAASLAWLFDTFDGQFFNRARDPALEQILGPAKAIEYGPGGSPRRSSGSYPVSSALAPQGGQR